MEMEALDEIVSRIGPLDERAARSAAERQASLTKPAGSLGRLEELGVWMAAVTGQAMPALHLHIALGLHRTKTAESLHLRLKHRHGWVSCCLRTTDFGT